MFWRVRTNSVSRDEEQIDLAESPQRALQPAVQGKIAVTDNVLQAKARLLGLNADSLGWIAGVSTRLQDKIPAILEKLTNVFQESDGLRSLLREGNLQNSQLANRLARYVKDALSGQVTDSYCKQRLELGELCAAKGLDISYYPILAQRFQQIVYEELVSMRLQQPEIRQFTQTLTKLTAFDTAVLEQGCKNSLQMTHQQELDAVHDQYKGEFNRFAEIVLEAAAVGDLTSRSDLNDWPEHHRALVSALNELLDSILVPLQEAIHVLEELKNRNLTARIEGQYVGDHKLIPRALNPALDDLSSALRQVAEVVMQVEEGAHKVAEEASALSSGASQQAGALQQIRSTVMELQKKTQDNDGNATRANELSTSTMNQASDGNLKMMDLVDSIGGIKQAAGQISKIVKVIEEIAFQTNLLSLNAAVEAARAGEHGKGFAVVAEEVRNLALRSAKQAKETTNLIDETIRKVESGVKIAGETADAFNAIVKDVEVVSGLVDKITGASHEQARDIEQVNLALGEIDTVTQNNSINARESADIAQQMSDGASHLRDLISHFQIEGVQWTNWSGRQARLLS